MHRKLLLSLLILVCSSLFFSSHVMAQKRYLLKAGMTKSEAIPLKPGERAIDVINRLEGTNAPTVIAKVPGKTAKPRPPQTEGVIDTIGYPDDSGFNTNFGFTDQDVAGYIFKSDAGGLIKEFWFRTYISIGELNGLSTLRVFNSNYDGTPSANVEGNATTLLGWMGYYPHVGDGAGEATPFAEQATGPYVSSGNAIGFDPLGTEIWLPGGLQVQALSDAWNGVIMGDWFIEPEFVPNEPFIFTLFNDSPWGAPNPRYELFSFGTSAPWQGIKFYEGGRFGSADRGWWVRNFMWGSYVVVEFTTDRAPVIEYLEELPGGTLDTGPQSVTATVTDDNPSGGPAGVATVDMHYSFNAGTEQTVAMTNVAGDDYEGQIPGGTPGDEITYYVTATDVNGNGITSSSVSYSIFAKSAGAQFLLVLNGLSEKGYPGEYYFYDIFNYGGMDYNYDTWAFGPLTPELLALYNTVIEVTSDGPNDDNVAAVKTWLDAGGKNYILGGDEVVGANYGWPGIPVNIPEGTNPADAFFDYLGLDVYYGDINYAASGDQLKAWPITAVPGDAIAGEMADTLAARGDTLSYHPDFEIGVDNWLDGFDVDGTVTTAFTAVPHPGAGSPPYGALTLACGFYKHDATLNNNVVYFAFDPLSLHAKPNTPNYYWYSATRFGPLTKALVWMGVVVGVERDPLAGIPEKFALAQNYPNPFNPSTKIEYSIPENSFVTLKVFNVLGQEVATLVNGEQDAGKYIAEFNSTKLSSGIYIYKLQAGNFAETKKMMLVK